MTVVDWEETEVPKLKEQLTTKILAEMEKQGLSQGEVGRLIGMDRKNVNKTLRGTERGVSINQLVRIANGIGLKVDMIIKRKK
ncbi:XRE family transcriptional regulator [Halobacteriovorax sp. HLS]|uniref:XRE family transcriptional regulator n=1 Tax=Halobacteriovorax sp. HLS TaxID=2234000 RepID=UPI000FDC9A27|nr:XRE family transcriptional regulator [Halobacteriovorax sp. HLS]